jgi:hypothetical protein
LIELAVEEQESFTFLCSFEHGMTRADSGSSHEARDFFNRGDGNRVFGEDSNTIATKIWDQYVFVLWVDENVMGVARILA